MRILALDPGSVRVGVAISDELRMMARPLEFIPAEPFPALVDRVKALIRDQQIELIVHDQDFLRGDLEEARQRGHRLAGQVHVGLQLQQPHRPGRPVHAPHQAKAGAIG